MSKIDEIVTELSGIAANPKAQLIQYKQEGKKVIGCLPYYVPEELVFAAGMVPMGMWGTNDKTISAAKEYYATFYCSIVQLDLEMLLDGTCDLLDGVITPTCCDTLRPNSQNCRVAMARLHKMPTIFLAHPQNRKPEYGITFCMEQYKNVKAELEKIAGAEITNDAILDAIKIYNKSRAARREFVKLANEHCDVITAVKRSAVLKAAFFLPKDVYTEKLEALNAELKAMPAADWKGTKVVTSGIICDNPVLLQILDDNQIAVAADDVAHETRAFRTDAPEDEQDGIRALALQFAAEDFDPILYDDLSDQNRRADHCVDLVKENGAQGVIVFMQQFCDPEEMEYPYLKKALDDAGIPHIKLGIDQQMRDFGQASTAIQAFADVLSLHA